MIEDKDIICVSSIDWDFVWQGHQEIMSTFARNGNRVLYIENTGIRAPGFGDLNRLKHRLLNWRKGIRGIREESNNLFVCSPLILPFPYSRIAKFINRFLLVNSIKVWEKAIGFKSPIIWTFLPTAVSVSLIDNIEHSIVVYYCIAEFAQLADSSKKVNRLEAELLRRCDIVFAQGEKIKSRCERYNRNVHIFPFGVNPDIFLKPARDIARPDDIKSIPGPILGYVGGVHKHIDFDLLKELADANPEASIVLVGPIQTEEAQVRLKGLENVHLLGMKDHSQLPGYIDAFDLCLIPYRVTEYTKTVYPTKLNEYLLRGKRVLSTALPEVARFVERFGDVVAISDSREDFIEKAKGLLKEPAGDLSSKKIADVADQNSWGKRISLMSDIIESAIYEKQKDAARSWRDTFLAITRTAKKRLAVLTAAIAISYIALFHTPLVWWAANPLKAQDPLARADAAIVLGGGVGETGRPGQGYEERVKYAAEIYKNGYAKKLIFSSGFVYALQEADVMKALAVSLGVSPGDIMLEKEARSTYENVKFSLAIAAQAGFRRVIFISSPYHMRRLKMTSDKFLKKDNYFIFSPIPRSLFYGDGSYTSLSHIKAILREYLGIIYYKFKGYA